MTQNNRLLLLSVLITVCFVDECLAAFFDGVTTVNVGTYRPRVFRRRLRRSALFHETATSPPISPIKTCPCSSKPCQHFGECKNTRTKLGGEFEYGFECTCFEEWEGDTCNICDSRTKVTVCENSCYGYNNNGRCNDGGYGHVTVDCEFGTDCSDCSARCLRVLESTTGMETTSEETTTPSAEPESPEVLVLPEPEWESEPEPEWESEPEPEWMPENNRNWEPGSHWEQQEVLWRRGSASSSSSSESWSSESWASVDWASDDWESDEWSGYE